MKITLLFFCSLVTCCAFCAAPDNSMRDHRIFGESLQNYYQELFEENFRKYESRIAKAQTRADALKIVADAKKRVKRSWNFPKEKFPLNGRVLKKSDLGGVILEHIIFNSRKNFTVTANFYLPARRKGKVPAVLFVQGHANSGKRHYTYARVCENLARRGIAVLSIDPIQQGERDQFFNRIQINCALAHNRLNRQLLALGESMSDWRTYDGIRAVDYLISRPEVDPERIGINGQSGGGTMTALIFANDERIKCAAPSCYITTFCANVQNELAADGEQIPTGFLADGGEMADLILARAPQPYRIIAQKGDYFDIRGARKTYQMVKKIYTLLGKPENISMTEHSGRHNYPPEGRQSAYEFFTSVFGVKNHSAECKLTPKTAALNCLEKNGVSGLKDEKNIAALGKEKALQLRAERRKRALDKKALREKISQLLKIGNVPERPFYRSLRMTEIEGKLFQRVGIVPEKYITATLFYFDTGIDFELRANKNAVLMLPDISSREELVKYFDKSSARSLFALDPRGMGESEPSTVDRMRRLYWDYGADYHFASLGLFLNKPFIGRRVYDILCAINLLRAHGAENITLKAFGRSRYTAIFAALLSDKNVRIELVDGLPVTYEQAFDDLTAPIPQSCVPHGILKIADIDEIYAECLKAR